MLPPCLQLRWLIYDSKINTDPKFGLKEIKKEINLNYQKKNNVQLYVKK